MGKCWLAFAALAATFGISSKASAQTPDSSSAANHQVVPPPVPSPAPSPAPPAALPAVASGSTKGPGDSSAAPHHHHKHSSSSASTSHHKYTDAEIAAMWPVAVPPQLPGSILPHSRIVVYYGNPMSKRMGILGQIPPDSMLSRLDGEVRAYTAADSTTPAIPALDLIVTVAQASAGSDDKYRLRMPDTLIDRVAAWADRAHALLFLDVQPGRSSVAAEIAPLIKYLERPTVHLALDPEFAMTPTRVPGKVVGTIDASTINEAAATLASLVEANHLPPKLLIVHRFTRPMVTHADRITLDPRVQIIMNMDGFGPDWMKLASYRAYVAAQPVEYTGIKLFYKNDKPLMSPQEVLGLLPVPVLVMFQ